MQDVKILIVDDEPLFADMMKTILTASNYKIDIAEDVKEALEYLKKDHEAYFLVLTDYNMPEETGIDLLKSVKKLFPLLEVIIITGDGSEDIAIQALRLGAMDYIHKPIIRDELLALVHKAFELNKLRRQNTDYYNQILHLKDLTQVELESFKLFIRGLEEELFEKNNQLKKIYDFLKKIEPSILSSDMKEELSFILDDITDFGIKF
jgi:DNA-binding NtrC family response regulator